MEKLVANLIDRKLFIKDDNILLSFSGGIDSCVLLEILIKLKNTIGFNLSLFHLNHMLRDDADRDQTFCEKKAKDENIEIHSFVENINDYAKFLNIGIEEAARLKRKEIIKKLKVKYFYNKILLAHHQDDNSENFFMNLMRGTGLKGLTGMKEIDSDIYRPLIYTTKNEIKEIALKYNIAYVEDHTNFLPYYHRNRIRLELIPLIKDLSDDSVVKRISKTMDILSREDRYLDLLTTKNFDLKKKSYKISDIINKDISLIYRFIILRVKKTKDLNSSQLDMAVNLIFNKGSGKIFIGETWILKQQDILFFLDKIPVIDDFSRKINLGINHFFGYKIIYEIKEEAVWGENTISIDLDSINGDLLIQNRRPGERMIPSGMNGSKKIKDILIEKKVPSFLRDFVPILRDKSKIYWLLGIRKANIKNAKGPYAVITIYKQRDLLYHSLVD